MEETNYYVFERNMEDSWEQLSIALTKEEALIHIKSTEERNSDEHYAIFQLVKR